MRRASVPGARRWGRSLGEPARRSAWVRARLLSVLTSVLVSGVWWGGPPARAQQPLPGMLPRKQLPPQARPAASRLKIGSWVEYSVRDLAGRRVFRWRVAIVGREGPHRLWWEHLLRFGRTRALIVKTLVEGSTTSHPRVVRAIWKPLGHQALEVPVQKAKGFMDLYMPTPKGRARDRGTEFLRVPGGSFRAHRYDVVDRAGRTMSFWSSPRVPIFGLVRLQAPNVVMELTGYGTGASTMIHEKPGKWPFGQTTGP